MSKAVNNHGDIRTTHTTSTDIDVEVYDDALKEWRYIGQLKSLYGAGEESYYFLSSDETVRNTYSCIMAAIDDLITRGHKRML